MGLKGWIKDRLSDLLRRSNLEIVPTEILYEWQRAIVDKPCWHSCSLSPDAVAYLKPDNPRLINLKQRYSMFHADVTTPSVWRDVHVSAEDVAYFRGDNAWVWQVRGKNSNVLAYAISFYYLKSVDRLGLLDRLTEDENFGSFVFSIAGHQVSRDLLDSIAEIYFLDRNLGLGSREAGFRVLDIGAGYGRLAHRMVNALSCVERYYCTDAVAVSTFVSDYYLRFRGADKAVVIPLDEIENELCGHPVDLAINIHSFSECRMQAIEWWIRFLRRHRVRNLMIVPNPTSGSGERLLLTNDGQDFGPLLEQYGYRTVVKEPKYLDPVVQEFGLYPSWYHLLELSE